MNILRPTLLALALTLTVSSSAFAGNIGGLRTTGNIGGTRSTGNIGGTRSPSIAPHSTGASLNPVGSRLYADGMLSGAFAGLIRMLLESGALL